MIDWICLCALVFLPMRKLYPNNVYAFHPCCLQHLIQNTQKFKGRLQTIHYHLKDDRSCENLQFATWRNFEKGRKYFELEMIV